MGRKETSGETVQKFVVGNKGNKPRYNRGSQISIPQVYVCFDVWLVRPEYNVVLWKQISAH